jgi:hypothetical protein
VCRENQSSRELVEKHLLVPLDQVSRYDIDSGSEEEEESELSSEASPSEEEEREDDDGEHLIQRRNHRLKMQALRETLMLIKSDRTRRCDAEWRDYAISHLDRDAIAGIRPRGINPQSSGVKRKASTLLPRFATCSTASPNSTQHRTKREIVCGIEERRSSMKTAIFGTMMMMHMRGRQNWRMILIMQTDIFGLVARRGVVRKGVKGRNIRLVGGCEKRRPRRMGIEEVWRPVPQDQADPKWGLEP